MVTDKFKGLEGRVRKELERIQTVHSANEQWSRVVGEMDAYQKVLAWIKELNDLEIRELDS